MEFTKGNIKLICADNMKIMAQYPDNYFDLAVVDPPYGINLGKKKTIGKCGKTHTVTNYKQSEWDANIPDEIYFYELFRVSKNQIIWGGNYYIDYLSNTRCVLFWSKQYIPAGFSMADCEMAWTSFDKSAKMVRVPIEHNCVSNNPTKAKKYAKIHQAQKPKSLYNWIYEHFTTKDMKILDTHGGSFNSAISAYYFGFAEYVGIEIDSDYFNNAVKRFKTETMQQRLF